MDDFWRRSTPGLFVPAHVDGSVVEQRILEQACRLPPEGAVTGWAALRLHRGGFFGGLAGDGRTPLPVPLAVPRDSGIRRTPQVVVRREPLPASDVVSVLGIRCTTPLRATFDEMRRHCDMRQAVVVLDMALAGSLIALDDFAAFVAGRAGWVRVEQVRSALQLADPGSCSPQESVLRLIWELDAGFPRPRCNVAVRHIDGSFVGRPDLLCEELAVVGEYVGADLNNVPLVVDRMRAAVERARLSGLPRHWMTRRR